MNSIYTLFITYLFYIFFGEVVDKLIRGSSSTLLLRIKIKVSFHTFIAPIMFGLVLFFVLFTDQKTLNVFYGSLLLIATLIRICFTQRKYLTTFHIVDDLISINYLTPFLKAQSADFNLHEISNIEVAKGNWIVGYPASLSLKYQSQWETFELIDRELKDIIQRSIDRANKSFG